MVCGFSLSLFFSSVFFLISFSRGGEARNKLLIIFHAGVAALRHILCIKEKKKAIRVLIKTSRRSLTLRLSPPFCRRCFVKTIQMAVSQRLLPLRCVICRAKILRLKQTLIPRDVSDDYAFFYLKRINISHFTNAYQLFYIL